MTATVLESSRRVLIVDDSRAIHEDFRKILCRKDAPSAASADETELFGAQPPSMTASFELDSAYQGQEAVEMIAQAQNEKRPYTLVFLDIRMPPGWDGVETAQRILPLDPDLQIVFCTAYSDYSWTEMVAKLGRSDRLVILKKPFDTVEVLQLAEALTQKWKLLRENRWQLAKMKSLVDAAMRDLHAINTAAEGAEGSRTTFLTAVGQELRTPTLEVVSLCHLLLSTDLAPQQRAYAEKILSTANASLKILDGISAGITPGSEPP